MHKNTLWLLFAILCIYLTLVFCEEQQQSHQEDATNGVEDISKGLPQNYSTELQEEARTRRHRHHLYHMWGWHALAIAYLVKLKIVVVAFFVGSAIYLGLRYFWPNKCNTEIILDHPPPSFSHHDHIPYSLSHSEHYIDHPPFDSSSFSSSSDPGVSYEPYSAYSGTYGGGDDVVTDTTSTETHSQRRRREVQQKYVKDAANVKVMEVEDAEAQEQARQRPMVTEEQIGHFMFSFLGLDSKACRRRFICEMEFRSKANPLTAMAFRVIGRSFFGQYTNDRNDMGRANSFDECAAVNSECVFIENEEEAEVEHIHASQESDTEAEAASDDLKVELPTPDPDNSLESNNNAEERSNYHNLLAERRNSQRSRVRGDRHLKL